MNGWASIYRWLEHPVFYHLLQAPFARTKLRPIIQRNDVACARRILDVGCGPGTNAAYFKAKTYLGIDINEQYVRYAQSRYQGTFAVADVRTFSPPSGERFDFVLLNSLLHHLPDDDCHRILAVLSGVLAPGGHVHILDLVLPRAKSVARWLVRHDRGGFARPLEAWVELFERHFAAEVMEPYEITLLGLPLWPMVYFRGAQKGE